MVGRVAVVTGGDEGVGFALTKDLCENYDGVVYLTARYREKGQAAVKQLRQLNLNPRFHQLDTTDQTSVDRFKDFMMKTHRGLDLLVNNTSINVSRNPPQPFGHEAEDLITVNYFGTLNVCDALFPLLGQNARVVNVATSSSRLYRIPSRDLRDKFSNPNLTIPLLNRLMRKFIRDAKEGNNQTEGWGTSASVVLRAGISALTDIQERIFEEEHPYRNILSNYFVDMDVHVGYNI